MSTSGSCYFIIQTNTKSITLLFSFMHQSFLVFYIVLSSLFIDTIQHSHNQQFSFYLFFFLFPFFLLNFMLKACITQAKCLLILIFFLLVQPLHLF